MPRLCTSARSALVALLAGTAMTTAFLACSPTSGYQPRDPGDVDARRAIAAETPSAEATWTSTAAPTPTPTPTATPTPTPIPTDRLPDLRITAPQQLLVRIGRD